MKVYTFFTDSHKVFLPNFMNSFPFEDNFDLEIKYFPQECKNGSYHSDGWNKTMKRKIEYIIYSLKNTSNNELFVHSDIDIQFFGNIKTDLEKLMSSTGKDILFQNDGHQLCMGFFVCKKNEKTINLFEKVLSDLHNHRDDQFAVNHHIGISKVNFGVLPEKYYTIGIKHKVWKGDEIDFIIPKDILMHHANFTEGVINKLNLLEQIKKKVNG